MSLAQVLALLCTGIHPNPAYQGQSLQTTQRMLFTLPLYYEEC